MRRYKDKNVPKSRYKRTYKRTSDVFLRSQNNNVKVIIKKDEFIPVLLFCTIHQLIKFMI